MPLELNNMNVGYLMGRKFAVYTKLSIHDDVNVENFKENNFITFMTKPRIGLGLTANLIIIYLNKLQSDGTRVYYEKLIQQIDSMINTDDIPKISDMNYNMMFLMGFNHQMNDFYTSKKDAPDNE